MPARYDCVVFYLCTAVCVSRPNNGHKNSAVILYIHTVVKRKIYKN